jgi:hypothetical protein
MSNSYHVLKQKIKKITEITERGEKKRKREKLLFKCALVEKCEREGK